MKKEELKQKIEQNYKRIGLFKRIFGWSFIIENIIKEIDSLDVEQNYVQDDKLDQRVTQLQQELDNTKRDLQFEKEELFKKEHMLEALTRNNNYIKDENKDLSNNLLKKSQLLSEVKVKLDHSISQQEELKEQSLMLSDKLKNSEIDNRTNEQKIKDLNDKIIQLTETKVRLSNNITELSTKNSIGSTQIEKLEKEKSSLEAEIKSTNLEIKKTTDEIHKIFTRTSGAKGKIAEIRLENILQTIFGDPGEHWITNLQPGSLGIERVEFGIKYDSGRLWIPVDSKALIPKQKTEENEYLIDQKYVNSVKIEIKKIKKYIGKRNTTDFALLVLPNDDFFMKLNEEYPEVFSYATNERVYITSPNNFTQFISTISQLQDKINLVNKQSNVISDLKIAFKHMSSFSNSVEDGMKKMNLAFERHLPNAKRKLEAVDKTMSENKVIESSAVDNKLIEPETIEVQTVEAQISE